MQQNHDRARIFFIVLEPAGIYYGHRIFNSRLLFLIMIFCFTSTNQNNGKLHEEPTNRLCCAKNELTIGLVYTEKMIDTQMSWLHILVKDRGSTFIVILKTFLQGKLFCFSLWPGSTC